MVLRSTDLRAAGGLLVPKAGLAQEASDTFMSYHARNNRRSGMATVMLLSVGLCWMGAENPAGILWSSGRVCNVQTSILKKKKFIFLACP